MSELNTSLRHGLNAWTKNPVLVHALGISPLLALSTSFLTAAALLACLAFLLFAGSTTNRLIRSVINDTWHIAALIFFLAVLTSLMGLLPSAYSPELREQLGIYLPLLCCNFAVIIHIESQHPDARIRDSIIPNIRVIAGYGTVLLILAAMREQLGNGTAQFEFALSQPGALLMLGLLLATGNALRSRFGNKDKAAGEHIEPAPRARVTEKLQ